MSDERINHKLDKLFQKVSTIDVTLASQHESLKEHIRRTEILETKVEPMEKTMHMMSGALKLGSVAIMCISALVGICEIIRMFNTR
jgi:endonuclease III